MAVNAFFQDTAKTNYAHELLKEEINWKRMFV